MEVNTTPVSAGEPIWEGEITPRLVEQILSGLLVPSLGLAKALAREVRRLREEATA